MRIRIGSQIEKAGALSNAVLHGWPVGRLCAPEMRRNPEGWKSLACEFLAGRLAKIVGLSVPDCEVVEVVRKFSKNDLPIATHSVQPRALDRRAPSLLIQADTCSKSAATMSGRMLLSLSNLGEFGGMLAFDKWTCNLGLRKAAFSMDSVTGACKATFVDHRSCFSAGAWDFPYASDRGYYPEKEVYRHLRGWEFFEPWLTRLETMNPQTIWRAACDIPPEWYGFDHLAIETLVETLIIRRGRIRSLITDFAAATRTDSLYWTSKFFRTRNKPKVHENGPLDDAVPFTPQNLMGHQPLTFAGSSTDRVVTSERSRKKTVALSFEPASSRVDLVFPPAYQQVPARYPDLAAHLPIGQS